MNFTKEKVIKGIIFVLRNAVHFISLIVLTSFFNYLLVYYFRFSKIYINNDIPDTGIITLFSSFFSWIWRIIIYQDFGQSLVNSQTVMERLDGNVITSLILVFGAIIVIIFIYLPIAYFSFIKNKLYLKKISKAFIFLSSIPILIMAILIRPVWVKYFGVSNYDDVLSFNQSLSYILPVILISLGDGFGGELLRHLEAVFTSLKKQPHLLAVMARNANYDKHIIRSAAVPVLSFLGSKISNIISSTIIVEFVFFGRGLSLLGVNAINDHDQYLTMAITFILSSFVIIIYLINKIVVGLIDPRLK